jgi:hypothetical protein
VRVEDGKAERTSTESTEAWLGARLLPESRTALLALGITVAVLAVVGIVGILPLIHAAFKPGVSQRVSKELGHSVSCTRVGETAVAGRQSSVYRCESESGTPRSAKCYSIVDAKVFPVYSLRKVGC